MVNRLLRDDPSKGDMNNRQAVGLRGLIASFWDFDLWPTYLVSPVLRSEILGDLAPKPPKKSTEGVWPNIQKVQT